MRVESNRLCVLGQFSKLRIFHHTDNFERLGGVRAIDSKSLTYRGAGRKESLGHRFADDRDFLRTGCVLRAKAPACDERNTHRCKKIRADNVVPNAAALWRDLRLFTRVSRTGPRTLVEGEERK